jgi:ech hydrogenase subunit B
MGPPIIQPFLDFLKLLGKELLVSARAQIVFAWAYLLLTVSALVLFFLGQDLLVIVFVLGFAGVCLVAGALASQSPYSVLGGQREIAQTLAYEPVLILFAIAAYVSSGTFNVGGIWAAERPLIASLPLVFVALLIVSLIKFRKSPFDLAASHHAHQELVRGVFTEFSGWTLAIIELGHWYELILVLALVGLFGGGMPILAIALALLALLFTIVVDNISARLTWSWMIKFVWVSGLGLAGANLLALGLGVWR